MQCADGVKNVRGLLSGYELSRVCRSSFALIATDIHACRLRLATGWQLMSKPNFEAADGTVSVQADDTITVCTEAGDDARLEGELASRSGIASISMEVQFVHMADRD